MQQWHYNKAYSCGRKCAFGLLVYYLRYSISAMCRFPFHFHRKKGRGIKLKKHDFLATAIWLQLPAIAYTPIHAYVRVCVGAPVLAHAWGGWLKPCLAFWRRAVGHFDRNTSWHGSYGRSLVRRRYCWRCSVSCHCYWCCCCCCCCASCCRCCSY